MREALEVGEGETLPLCGREFAHAVRDAARLRRLMQELCRPHGGVGHVVQDVGGLVVGVGPDLYTLTYTSNAIGTFPVTVNANNAFGTDSETIQVIVRPVMRSLNVNAAQEAPNVIDVALAELNLQSVRVGMEWHYMEPTTKGTFAPALAAQLDRFLPQFKARGIKVIVPLISSPGWANGGQGKDSRNFTNAEWLSYISRINARWGQYIEAYQVWNEPGLDGFLQGTQVEKADRYASLLKASYTHIKSLDATKIVTGVSLYQAVWGNQQFLQLLYDRGIKDYFDVLDQHMYSDTGVASQIGSSHPIPYSRMFKSVQDNTVQTMIRNGDGAKKIWVTETGLSTGTTPAGRVVTEAQQASGLTDCYNELAKGAASACPSIERVYWYRLPDASTFSTDFQNRWGLLLHDFTNVVRKKPAWSAFAAVPN